MRRLESLLVHAIALHSLGVGLALLLLPEWGARLGGFGAVAPLFFARQGGAFHVVLAAGYTLEYRRERRVTLMLVAKASAFLFLTGCALLEPSPWVVPFSAVADGLMGLAVLAVRRAAGAA